ncbi:MAG: hypothetical protein ACK2U9_12160, partial [Anaerolineae bacterium]
FEILQGCTLLSQAHAVLTREWLKLEPQAVLGVSSGETNSVFALDAWRDMDAMFAAMDSQGMYTREIAGDYATAKRAWQDRGVDEIDWVGWRVLAPVAEVEAALAGEAFAYLTMINAPADCLIAGQADACARVVDKLGRHRAVENRAEIIAHHPVMQAWEEPWYAIHARATRPVPGVRFYSNASGTHYAPTRETVAAALTDQATKGVDFRRVVDAAWRDGVRIFIEHGPRNSCTNYIRSILGEREHFAVALDRPENGVDQALDAVAQLVAAGVALDYAVLTRALTDPAPPAVKAAQPRRALSFPAHYPPVIFPPLARTPVAVPTRAAASALAAPPAPSAPSQATDFAAVANSTKEVMTHEFQTMPPAPPLVPVLSEQPPAKAPAPTAGVPAPPEPAPPEPAPQLSTPVASVHAREARSQRAPTPTPVQAKALAQLKAFHAQVVEAHQAFLAQQARALALLVKSKAEAEADAKIEVEGEVEARGKAEVRELPPQQPHTPTPPQPPTPPARANAPDVISVTGKTFPGPKLTRAQLEHVASHKISEVLGAIFE